jgi:hypothetical protein
MGGAYPQAGKAVSLARNPGLSRTGEIGVVVRLGKALDKALKNLLALSFVLRSQSRTIFSQFIPVNLACLSVNSKVFQKAVSILDQKEIFFQLPVFEGR